MLSLSAGPGFGGEPKAACDNPVFDFGAADDQATISHAFVLKNIGTAPLLIKKVHGCCGASTELKDSTIPPGSNTTLNVSLSLKGRLGRVEKHLFVESNDPSSDGLLQISLVGATASPMEIKPLTLDFGSMRTGDGIEKTADVVVRGTNLLIHITNVTCTVSNFAVRLTTLEEGRSYRVAVTSMPPLSMGVSVGEVRLVTDHPKYRLADITILARVSRDIVAAPGELTVSLKDQRNAITRSLILRSRTLREFKILKVDVPDPEIKTDCAGLGPGSYRVTFSNITPSAGLDGTKVVIRTDQEDAGEIAIPFRVVPTGGR